MPEMKRADELVAYEDYIEWDRSFTWDGSGTPERALVRGTQPVDGGRTYVYVGMIGCNDNKTVPSDTVFVFLGKVER